VIFYFLIIEKEIIDMKNFINTVHFILFAVWTALVFVFGVGFGFILSERDEESDDEIKDSYEGKEEDN
jgi:hypothetical protein